MKKPLQQKSAERRFPALNGAKEGMNGAVFYRN